MKNKSAPKRISAFERETDRRRRAMLRDIGGYTMRLTPAFLRSMPRHVRKFLLTKPAPKASFAKSEVTA